MSLAPQDAGRTQSGHRGSADHRECGTDRAVPLQECSSRDIPVSRTYPGHSGNSYSRTMCGGSWQRPGIQSLRPVPSWQSQGVAPCEHLSAALAFGQWTAHVRSLSDTPCTLHTVRASRTVPDSAGQPWPWEWLSPCDCCQLPSAGSSCPGVRVTGRSTGRACSSVWQRPGEIPLPGSQAEPGSTLVRGPGQQTDRDAHARTRCARDRRRGTPAGRCAGRAEKHRACRRACRPDSQTAGPGCARGE